MILRECTACGVRYKTPRRAPRTTCKLCRRGITTAAERARRFENFAAEYVGRRFGTRTITAITRVHRTGTGASVRTMCECGLVDELSLSQLRARGHCMACLGRAASRGDRHAPQDGTRAAMLAEAGRRAPQAWRWEEPACVEACAELAELLGPLQLHEIAALLGVSRQRVEQIEKLALAKLRRSRDTRDALESADRRLTTWDEIAMRATAW
jgi:hypothetical protein